MLIVCKSNLALSPPEGRAKGFLIALGLTDVEQIAHVDSWLIGENSNQHLESVPSVGSESSASQVKKDLEKTIPFQNLDIGKKAVKRKFENNLSLSTSCFRSSFI